MRATIIVRCQHTGHYILIGVDRNIAPFLTSGRVYCPYCAAEHVWSDSLAASNEWQRSKTLVCQAT